MSDERTNETEPSAENAAGPAGERKDVHGSGLESIPGVIRFAASAWWNTTAWAADQYVKVAKGIVGAAPSAEEAADRFAAAANEVTRSRANDKPTLAESGEMAKASQVWLQLIAAHPDSTLAALARANLQRLN